MDDVGKREGSSGRRALGWLVGVGVVGGSVLVAATLFTGGKPAPPPSHPSPTPSITPSPTPGRQPWSGEPAGVMLLERSITTDDVTSALAIFDPEGGIRICARVPGHVKIVASWRDEVLFLQPEHRGTVWSLSTRCTSPPRVRFEFEPTRGLRQPRVSCVGRTPDGRTSIIVKDRHDYRRSRAFIEDGAGGWSPIEAETCVWITDTHSVSQWEQGATGQYLIDAGTGRISFVQDPMLLSARFSPDGHFAHAPRPSQLDGSTRNGAIIDIATGEIVGRPGGKPPERGDWGLDDEPFAGGWSPSARYLRTGRGRIWDVEAHRFVRTIPAPLAGVNWIDDDTVVGQRSGGFSIWHVRSRGEIELEPGLARFHERYVYGFAPDPAAPAFKLIADTDVPLEPYKGLFSYPVIPGWDAQRCRTRNGDVRPLPGTGCEIAGYRFDRELRSPGGIYEDMDVVTFGNTKDSVAEAVRRLTHDVRRCAQPRDESDSGCMVVHRRDVTIMGQPFVKLERGFWEWSSAVYVGRVGPRTVLIGLGSSRLEKYDPLVGWVLDHLTST